MYGQMENFCVSISVLFVFFLSSATYAADNSIQPGQLPASGEISLFPEKVFDARHWWINKGNKGQKVEMSFPSDKTPAKEPVIKIEFKSQEGGAKVLGPSLKEGGEWRSRDYDAISFWIKNNGQERKVQFVVTDLNGASGRWNINLDSSEWKKIILKAENSASKQEKIKKLSQMKYCYFFTNQDTAFSVGDFRLEPCASGLPVSSVNAVVIPELKEKQEIVLDGTLNEAVWQKARKFDKMFLINKTAEQAKEKTETLLFSDGRNLYIGIRMQCADTSKLIAKQKERDMSIWQDDCVEIMVDDVLDAKSYRHLVINPIDTVADYHHRFDQTAEAFIFDKAWNPEYPHKSRISGKEWTLEVQIPLDVLGLKTGIPFGLQIARENHSANEISSIFPAENRLNVPKTFALAFIGTAETSFSNLSINSAKTGELTLKGKLTEKGKLELQLFIADPYAKLIQEKLSAESDNAGQFSCLFSIKAPVDGAHRIVLCGKINGKNILPSSLNFNMNLPPEIIFGDIFLNPKPKEIKLTEGRFSFDGKTPIALARDASERTRKTARFMRTEALLNLFNILPPITSENVQGKCFSMMLKKDAKNLDEETLEILNKLPAEGYYLDVKPEKVTIIGSDEAGLYYGVVSFVQLLKANLIKKHEMSIGCARIVDWPELPFRIVHQTVMSAKEEKYNVNDIKNYIKTYIAGNKYNFYSFHIPINFEYDKTSGISRINEMISKEDYAEIARFAKEHFIEFVPAFQSGGHSNFITRAYPEFQEPGYSVKQVNVLHEKWHDFLFGIYDEILSSAPETKYFHIWHDEWWTQPKEAVKDSFMGKKRWEIFADELIKNNDYFKKRGIQMVMFCDMLLKGHNGGYPLNISKALDKIPRDIIMSNWSMRSCPDGTRELTEKGFKMFDTTNQFNTLPEQDIKLVSGHGCISYWLAIKTSWGRPDEICADYSHAIFRAADYNWNFKRDSQLPLGEWRRRYLNNVNALYNFPERRTAYQLVFKTIDLSPYANASTKECFGDPQSAPLINMETKEIAFIPVSFAKAGENDLVAATPEKPEISVKLDRTAKGFFILQAAYVPKDKKKTLKGKNLKYLYGVPVGEIRIEYEEGPTEILPLRMGFNTNDIIPVPSTRFMQGTRYTHDIKTAGASNAALYMIEWANPYPARKIKQLTLKRYDNDAVPVIFTVTSY